MCNSMCMQCKDRMRELDELRCKFMIIEEVDRVKSKLFHLDPKRSFRDTIRDRRLKKELEDIFDCPFIHIQRKYLTLLNKRNQLVHSHSAVDRGFRFRI